MRVSTIKSYLNILIVFMVIFAFPIGIIASNKIIIIASLIFFFIHPKFQNKLKEAFINKNALYYFIITFTFSLYSLLITVLKGEYDFSLFRKQIGAVIYFPLILIIFNQLKNNDLPDLIIKAFILQSIVITLAIVSEQFYSITDFLRNEIGELHFKSYNRLRGNAIAGYQFFGIGTMYGFAIIYFFLHKDLTQIKNIITILFISIIGIISSRYTVIAVLIGFFFWYFFIASFKRKIKSLILFCIIAFFILLGLIYIYNNYLSAELVGIINYQILLPIDNLFSNSTIKSSSTDGLFNMYRNLEFKNILFGEGRYINETGEGYYKNVDPGYLRMLYYYGITGLTVLILIQYLLFNLKKSTSKSMHFTKISFFIYFLLLNFKGDVFFYSSNALPLVLGLLYYNAPQNRSDCKIKEDTLQIQKNQDC